jgi:hypothetical protein
MCIHVSRFQNFGVTQTLQTINNDTSILHAVIIVLLVIATFYFNIHINRFLSWEDVKLIPSSGKMINSFQSWNVLGVVGTLKVRIRVSAIF